MTCRDVMTPDPACCLANDSASEAARLMRDKNVGPVPVVADQHSKRLVGIVTDRDLAVQVVAEGRSPDQVRIGDVMSADPVTCRAEDDYDKALEVMAKHQIRRIPVVDSDGLLIGIIAQADVARRSDSERIGEVVEEISQPRTSRGLFRSRGDSSSSSHDNGGAYATRTALVAGAAGLGAGLMYFFDPARGRYRRLSVRDRAGSAWDDSREYLSQKQQQMQEEGSHMDRGTATRIAASVVGGGLLFYGLRNRSRLGHIATTAGLGLLARGIMNKEVGWMQPAKLAGMLRGGF